MPISTRRKIVNIIDENSDEDAFIARVDVEDGEEVYVDPTEEEFQAVMKAYEAILAEDDEEA